MTLATVCYVALFLLFSAWLRRATFLALAYALMIETLTANIPGVVKRITVSFYANSWLYDDSSLGLNPKIPAYDPVSGGHCDRGVAHGIAWFPRAWHVVFFPKGVRIVAGLRQLAERSARKFAGPVYRMLQRRSGQRLAKRFATPRIASSTFMRPTTGTRPSRSPAPVRRWRKPSRSADCLPALLAELGASSLLDLPCGDFHWMQHTDLGGVLYIGGDLVGDLIERNRAKYARDGVTFQKIDLVNDTLPAVDAILCRDCLVHLSFDDAQAALANIARSGARWLLTTSFPEVARNDDIVTGQWRPINLRLPPFNLSEPKQVIAENCAETEFADKTLSLWSVEDVR